MIKDNPFDYAYNNLKLKDYELQTVTQYLFELNRDSKVSVTRFLSKETKKSMIDELNLASNTLELERDEFIKEQISAISKL